MKLKRVSVHGVTTFHHPVTLDLEPLGRLVALVGQNGAGKTTLLEAVPASAYKRMPSRPGSLYDHCHGRDAYVESVFEDGGHEYTLRVRIDTDQRKAEQFVFRDGEPLTTGRNREHAAVVEQLFGSEALFLSSAFACQTKAGSFLFLPKVERKQLLIEMLGLAHLETLAEGARSRSRGGDTRLAELRGALQTMDAKAAELAAARVDLAAAEDACTLVQFAVTQAETNEAAARTAHQEAVSKADSAKGLQQQHADALKRLDAARARTRQARTDYDRTKKDLENKRAVKNQQIAGCRAILAKEPEVAAARERLQALEDEETALRLVDIEASDARQDLGNAESDHQRSDDAVKASAREGGELQRRSELDASCRPAEEWHANVGATGTITAKLAEICPLLGDSRQARERLVEVQKRHQTDLELYGRTSVHLRAAKAEVNRCEEKKRGMRARADIVAERTAAQEVASKDMDAQRKWLAQMETELALIEHDMLDRLDEALIRNAEAEEREAKFKADELAAAHTEAACAVRNLQRCADDLQAAEKATKNTRESQLAANGCRAGLESVIDRLEADVNQTGALRQELADVETQLGDWNLLAQALGKDGVQALEIDAAGPEIARICNELLEACYGPRFSLSFETLREKKSKPGEFSESFDVRVLDGGRERSVEALSGGERVIVGESLGLAIAILNARKNNVRHRTLYRDETAGALDPAAGQAYVDMLRRALDLGGFEQCLFVSHSPEVWQRADTRIRVSGGTAAVEV